MQKSFDSMGRINGLPMAHGSNVLRDNNTRETAGQGQTLFYCVDRWETLDGVFVIFNVINRGGTPLTHEDYARAKAMLGGKCG